MISVVIPVRNGGDELARCLDAIARQDVDDELEVVVIDSSSEDGSADLARSRGARVETIPVAEFNHGATRNLGARLARGDLLAFTSQDAHAEGADWLGALTARFADEPELAGVYGRQLPHPGAKPAERYFLDYLYGPTPRLQAARTRDEISMDTSLFSNVNSAIRREVWERFPFADDMIMSEDQEWAVRVLLAGHSLCYEPGAVVRHSHPYTIRSAFRRFFDSGVSAERAYLAGARPSARVLRSRAWRYARDEVRWLWREGAARWLPYTAVYELAKYAGLALGTHHRRLPLRLKRRLSAMPGYWEDPGERAG
jgi:rhamnosyltransferase